MSEPLGNPELLIHATVNLGFICNTVGDYRQAAAQLARAASLIDGRMQRERLGRTIYPAAGARAELARALADLGRFDDAMAAIEEALRIAESLQHATTLLSASTDRGHVLICRGDWNSAVTILETCLDAFRSAGLTGFGNGAAAMLGYARAMSSHQGEGIALVREALEHAAQGRRTREALFMTYLSEALLMAQRMDEAAAVAGRGLMLSLERGERGTEARARYVLGEIAAKDIGGDGSAAQQHLHEALALAEELGMRPLVAQCHLALATLSRQRGEPRASQQHLDTASAMFHELGMQSWSERAEELKAIGGNR